LIPRPVYNTFFSFSFSLLSLSHSLVFPGVKTWRGRGAIMETRPSLSAALFIPATDF
jgi:hypothetical protein